MSLCQDLVQYQLKSCISCQAAQEKGFSRRRFVMKSYPLTELRILPKMGLLPALVLFVLSCVTQCLTPAFLSLQHHMKVESGKLESTFLINTLSNPRL